MRVVPDEFRQQSTVSGRAGCGSPMQIVSRSLQYFSLHYSEPCVTADMLLALQISEDCLSFSFDQVRGMTPAQALQEHRLNRLFTALTEHPRQGLAHAIAACGLGATKGVVPMFEQTFGIEMPLFLLTCRRAADDRHFRSLHPDADDLVLLS
jgi:methylphosphotriester-DNA--protein-cysteine methyltransferase